MNLILSTTGQRGARIVPLRVPVPDDTLLYTAVGRAVATGLHLVIDRDGHVCTTPWLQPGDQQIAVRVREAT